MSISAFAYVNAEKASLYRAVMRVFANAKRHFVVHLRPEDVAEEVQEGSADEVQAALEQLVQWGNLQSEPDTGRVTSVEDFYRARYLYQITREGEAAEAALAAFDEALGRRGALQAVALQDIRFQLRALQALAAEPEPDPARVHALLRDITRVFSDLAENAQAFMAGLGRTLELRGADRDAFIAYKDRLIEYLERFIGDLVTASAEIARLIEELNEGRDGVHGIERLFILVAEREAADAAPAPDLEAGSDDLDVSARMGQSLAMWHAHWRGLRSWFVGSRSHPSQAALLRNRARKAISQLVEAVVRLNERRLGRSDRSADFRTLARWFAGCESDAEAHRLWRAAFGLSPARHLTVDEESLLAREQDPVPANTAWMEAPPLRVSPRLRATGSYQKRGAPPKVRRRDKERGLLARQLAEESAQTRAARRRLATGRMTRLSELGELDEASFALFLQLLGDALAAAREPEACIQTVTGDGSLQIELEPLEPDSCAAIRTPNGIFRGRDYRLRIIDLDYDEESTQRFAGGVR